MGMLSAIGWISAADHVVFRREGWPLSLSRGGKRNEYLVFDNGADLSFRSVRYFCTVIVEVFQKERKKEKRQRGLDKQ